MRPEEAVPPAGDQLRHPPLPVPAAAPVLPFRPLSSQGQPPLADGAVPVGVTAEVITETSGRPGTDARAASGSGVRAGSNLGAEAAPAGGAIKGVGAGTGVAGGCDLRAPAGRKAGTEAAAGIMPGDPKAGRDAAAAPMPSDAEDSGAEGRQQVPAGQQASAFQRGQRPAAEGMVQPAVIILGDADLQTSDLWQHPASPERAVPEGPALQGQVPLEQEPAANLADAGSARAAASLDAAEPAVDADSGLDAAASGGERTWSQRRADLEEREWQDRQEVGLSRTPAHQLSCRV